MKILFKILSGLLKYLLLFPLYCMMPDKYSGITFDEWLKNKDN